jgi:uncharacterized membrane protein YdjX (TVP38/TMEM64 family)
MLMNRRNLFRLVIGILAMAALLVAIKYSNVTGLLRDSLAWIRGLGVWAPIAFIAIYAVACVLAIPASILTLGGGFLFGFVWGLAYVMAGAVLGAVAAFLTGRYLARDWVAKKIEGHEKFKAIDEAIGREGWRIVLLMRLAPIFPYAILNYGFALTRVSLRHYAIATAIGIVPAMMAFVYFGSLVTDLTELRPGSKVLPPAMKWGIAIITLIVAVLLTRIARRSLNRALKSQPE